MNFNFELILVLITGITGLIYFLDVLAAKHQDQTKPDKVVNFVYKLFYPLSFVLRTVKSVPDNKPWHIDWSQGFFVPLLIVLIVRSFVVEPFRIPSGSLKPTLLPGDFIAVNKFAYGLKLPLTGTKILPIKEPKRGDIIVFRYPPNPNIDYIKRVVGVPGDHITYINKELYINGKHIKQHFLNMSHDDEDGRNWPVQVLQEKLNGVSHRIFVNPDIPAQNFYDITVPKGEYFVLGDNRDDSADSRYWGFVPEKNILGKAFGIWLSWGDKHSKIRWSRMGTGIH